MGNERRQRQKEFFDEKKRSDISPRILLDRIEKALRKSQQIKSDDLINTLSRLKRDIVKHSTNKNMLLKFYSELNQFEKMLGSIEQKKLSTLGGGYQKIK